MGELSGNKGFSLRAVIIASLVTLFLLASSSYVALKIGALPWPIVFSVVVCAGILSLLSIFKKTNIHEINVAQAGASIGGLMASALVFVIPGIWYLQKKGIDIPDISIWKLILICVSGGILGVLLSIPLRRYFIDKEKLPFPSGFVGAETLKSSNKGTLGLLIFIGALAGIFSLTRDFYFATGFSISFLASYGIFMNIYPMPLAIGVGYILGEKGSYSWFIGAFIGWFILIPLLIFKGIENEIAITITQNLGMGLVIGSGIGFVFLFVFPKLKKILSPIFSKKSPIYMRLSPIISLIVLFILYLVGVPLLASLITIFSVWIVSAIAARMTGETNIDPLEQFGIIVGLICLSVYSFLGLSLGYESAFLIVCFVAVVAAIAGDIGHDYKSAKIIGTRPIDIIKIDLITVIIAGVAGPFVLEIIRKGFFDSIFTEVMPAPQAQIVASSIIGFPYPSIFFLGLFIAFTIEIIRRYKNINVLMMPLGIGMFLGLGLSLMLLIGGLIKTITRKFSNKDLDNNMIVGAAGIMGGEGIAGFIVAIFFVFGILSFYSATIIVLYSMIILALIGIYLIYKKRLINKKE